MLFFGLSLVVGLSLLGAVVWSSGYSKGQGDYRDKFYLPLYDKWLKLKLELEELERKFKS